MNVLIVDDAPDVRRLLRTLIETRSNGWTIVGEAGNGKEAVDCAIAAQPSLVLLDLSMPVMDGLEALPLLRLAVPGAVVVVLTGFPDDAARREAMTAGAHAYIEKENLVRGLIPTLEDVVRQMPRNGSSPPASRSEG